MLARWPLQALRGWTLGSPSGLDARVGFSRGTRVGPPVGFCLGSRSGAPWVFLSENNVIENVYPYVNM